jgi:hypothetical protein
MNLAFLAFLVSVVVSLLSFTLIASWYVVPRLSKQPYVQALLPLVLLNVFRTEGFVFLLPQVMGGTLPSYFAVSTAYGDVFTAVLALLTALVLRLRPGLALPLVWLLNIVGFADLLFAIYKGVVVGFPFRSAPVPFVLKGQIRLEETQLALLLPLSIDDILIECRSALEAGEGHNLGNAILLGSVELFGAIQLLWAQRLAGFAPASCASTGTSRV